MKHVIAIALLAALTSACRTDETLRAYGGGDRSWKLVELNGAPFIATATLTFPKTGEIAGMGPCNPYFGTMDVPYPWFAAGPISSTRIACPDLPAETAFLTALATASLSEVLGNILILSNTEGLQMVFKATD